MASSRRPTINVPPRSLKRGETDTAKATPTHNRLVELLSAIESATRGGLITWNQDPTNADRYHGSWDENMYPLSIWLQFPAMNEAPSDRAAAHVTTPHMAGVKVFSGTPAMDRIWGILAAGFPESWGEHFQLVDEGLARDLATVRKALRLGKPLPTREPQQPRPSKRRSHRAK